MIKNWALLISATIISTFIILGSIRYYAPTLLGIPADLQLVRVDEKIPPFYDGVFREADHKNNSRFVKDPIIRRMKPFFQENGNLGPHDLLGFRNRRVPNQADIITIGDSQTYGLNAKLEKSWPYQLLDLLPEGTTLYSMAADGWGAMEYWEIFQKALFLKPKVVIIAFYTGNDPADSFIRAYGNPRWKRFRIAPNLTKSDFPKIKYPPPKEDTITLSFRNKTKMQFTPKYRHGANNNHPAIQTGYGIMAEAAKQIATIANENGVKIVFTIIPTKEQVYAQKLAEEKIETPLEYQLLIRDEKSHIIQLESKLKKIPTAVYSNVIDNLSNSASSGEILYPASADGHPLPKGYNVIAESIFPAVNNILARQ